MKASPLLRRLPISLAVAAAVLAGCAAPSPTRPADTLAALPAPALPAGATVQPGLAIERWWTLFDDAELTALVEQALARNHDLGIAAARVREARARLDEARGARLPSLELQAGHSRARQAADALPPGAERIGSSHSAALVGRYDVDLWGRLAAGSRAAQAQLRAQEWTLAGVQWSLTAHLAETHFSLRALQRQIGIAEAMRSSRGATLDLRRREQAAGSASEFELRRAQAELAETEVTLASLRRQRVSLEATLALLAGRSPEEAAAPEAARTPLDPTRPFAARLPEGDAGAMLLRRPDLLEAEARLAAAREDVAGARAATLPAVRLTGSLGSDARTLAGLFDGPGFVWSVALNLAQSVFDGGQARARVDQAAARAEAAHIAYRQAVLGAVVELRQAYDTLALTEAAQRGEQDRVAALERARTLARTGVRAGALSPLDELDAERNAFSAQLAEVTAYRDRLIGQVAAYKALGGGAAVTAHP